MPHILQRELTAAQWAAQNPVLYKGEIGWESGATPKAKKGDGVTAWNSLPYAVQPSTGAPLASPVFTGDPKAPTPAPSDNDTSIATTAFVKSQGYAPLADPTFTGDPKAPTPATADNDTSIATTAFVKAVLSAAGYAPIADPTFTGDPKAPTPATADNDTSIATTAFVKAVLAAAGYAPLASPTFTGDPKAPTPATTDNDTSIATTAFVKAQMALRTLTLTSTDFASGHTGTLVLNRVGSIVFASGGISRSAAFVNNSYYTLCTIPTGYTPNASVSPPTANWFNSTEQYQFNLSSVGTLQLRITALVTNQMQFVTAWYTTDA